MSDKPNKPNNSKKPSEETSVRLKFSELSPESVVHVRRCHVCGTVNEAEGSAIHQCQSCGKHLAPFYYFDESKLEGIVDSGLFLSQLKFARVYNPIWGLSTYWF